MKKILALSLLPMIAGCMNQPPMEASPEVQSLLNEKLAGRVAEAPQNCVPQRDLRDNTSFGEGAIVFTTPSNSLIYVNRPPGGCPRMGAGRAIRTRTTISQLCSGDIVDVFDNASGTPLGSCSLGEFTPYRRLR
jgi:hypothetical protein